ncbi:MAG: ATP-binding protein [Aestuariivita sp.]|nr:ATP-binding protein [Aestuariivita sp.]MCY4203747.1 ATP-binding protein [Aestuariivita sp.]
MYKRQLTASIIASLGNNPAVAILGPRQIGKTTLALEIAKRQPSVYLDLENPSDLQKLNNFADFFDFHANKLVIIDEIQRSPDLFMPLRGVIDTRRREGRGNGRFLVLGSASNDLLRQTSESLAGRIHYAELPGLNLFEIEQPANEPLRRLWLRGGFPNSYSAADDTASYTWRQDFIRTYLERDIPQLGPRISAATLMRFWTMLAHTHGEQFNASRLANSLGVKSITVSRYLDLMIDLLLLRKLEPFYRNTKKRLVKSPRVYVRDSGVLHTLLQIPDYNALLGHPSIGKSWEGFVVETIINALPIGAFPFYYRTSAGAEIDLLIEFGLNNFWAVEIKANQTPKVQKGFHVACEDLKVRNKFIVYTGNEKFFSDNKTTILSLSHFIDVLRAFH